MKRLMIGAALAVACAFYPAVAREQVPAEERLNGYTANLPACNDPGVIAKVRNRFESKEETYWNSDLKILDITKIHATAFRPNGLDLIPRRFCQGVAVLSNNKTSRVFFSVAEDLGFIGQGYGVQFCVEAYDRNWASAPECKMAKP